MYGLGYDIGSSSIKAALVDLDTKQPVAVKAYPPTEMEIQSPQPGWAEQDPEVWWENLITVTHNLLEPVEQTIIDAIVGIGISYQMHGLVLLDKEGAVLRPSIIWCDSRAVEVGHLAEDKISSDKCYDHMLNVPGNFTGSKLRWVMDHEPDIYKRIDKLMLPGDFLNFKLTGRINTTPSGLSEGILWDFKNGQPASFAFEALGISDEMIPEIVSSFGNQGSVTTEIADQLGIPHQIPVCYRAGDQPNNAMSLSLIHI